MQKLLITLLISALTAPLFAAELNIYSARKEQLIKPILDVFTKETGIKVNLVTGKADALLVRLQHEGKLSPADLLLTTDAGRLHRAKAAGLLQSIESETLNRVLNSQYRDKDNQWFALSIRARPILFDATKITAEQLSSYEQLANAEFKGKICIRSSANIYNQSLVASMIAATDYKSTLQWAKAFTRNFAKPPKGGDRDQIKAAASGICPIAIANTYYLAAMLEGNNAQQKAAAEKLSVFWPNQKDRGTHVNISGAGVLKSAKNKTEAIQLLEFLLSEKAQAWYANVNFEYPVLDGVPLHPRLASWGDFKADTANINRLGELNQDAVKIMDKAGWR